MQKIDERWQKVIDEKRAAKYIGMSRSYLRRARMEGQIGNRAPGPPFYKIGRACRYRISDLDVWLNQHRRECG